MDDLISRQAAIAAIKTWGLIDGLAEGQAIEILADEEKLPSAQPQKVCVAEVKVEIDDIKDYIDKAINAERWIPVSERLPDEDYCTGANHQYSADVLITAHNADDEETIIDYGHTIDGAWYSDTTDCTVPSDWKVIAWMPLPEPYGGEA